jgi:segregation and condensation protein B
MNEKYETELATDNSHDELKNIVEAAIMVSEEPITVDKLLSMFTDATKPQRATVKDILLELEQEYANRGFELKRIDKGYRLQTREEYSPWLARLNAGRPPRYSRAMLETLAIIAYRQPVTRGEIEEIRGVAVSTDIIRNLQERDWVRQVGVRDVPGKPALFATTRSFLEYFNLEGLGQLPTLQDIRDMDTIAAELNMKLPLDEDKKTPDDDTAEIEQEDNMTDSNIQGDLLENSTSIDKELTIDNDSSNKEVPATDENFSTDGSPTSHKITENSNEESSVGEPSNRS